jgi:gamma-glutamylcyclotransferase (GGCT)/AIG2-like uncharacterized protein YtfP
MTKRLFVYGTLRPGREPAPLRPFIARLKLVGPATVEGTLYDLGTYPGMLFAGAGRVSGEVFEVPDDNAFWHALDDYEGFDPLQPEKGLFRREACSARMNDGGEVACDIYVYNGTPSESQRVGSGRWRQQEQF